MVPAEPPPKNSASGSRGSCSRAVPVVPDDVYPARLRVGRDEGSVERRVQVVRVVRERRRGSAGAVAAVEHVLVSRGQGTDGARSARRRSGRPASARRPASSLPSGRNDVPGRAGSNGPDREARPADDPGERTRARRRRGSCPRRRSARAHRTCSLRCDPRLRDRSSWMSHAVRVVPARVERVPSRPSDAQSAGSDRAECGQVRERAGDPRADQAVLERARRAIGRSSRRRADRRRRGPGRPRC